MAVRMTVEVQIADDIQVCCTWGRRCGSPTISEDTCEWKTDRHGCFEAISLTTPKLRQFALSLSEASLDIG